MIYLVLQNSARWRCEKWKLHHFCIPLSFSWALCVLTLYLNAALCGRHLEKLDAIIKANKVAQIWITQSPRHEYSRDEREWTRIVPRQNTLAEFSFYRSHFQDKEARRRPDRNQQLWAISLTLFHSPHWLSTHLWWLCEGRDCNSSDCSSQACYIYATLNMKEESILTFNSTVPVIKALIVPRTYRKERHN